MELEKLKLKRKEAKAKTIIAKIFDLAGTTPKVGDWELNRATDAMYDYIKQIKKSSLLESKINNTARK